MSDDGARIEFPCDYPIRIIGARHQAFRTRVLEIVRAHAGHVPESAVSVRHSRDGTYCSVRVTIVATGEDQLSALHAALMAESDVRMVL
ncbi:MAG: YbeD family protein [Pseudomonadota bacterium]